MALRAWHSLPRTSAVAKCCLWSFERYKRQCPNAVKNVLAVLTVYATGPYVKVLGNVHFIDPGDWRPGGFFSFVELESLEALCGPTNSPVPGGRTASGKDWGCAPASKSVVPPFGLPQLGFEGTSLSRCTPASSALGG